MKGKYHVSDKSKRTYNGIVFDSSMEMRYYVEIVLPGVANGSIIDYELQKPYELQPKFKRNEKTILSVKYVADFWIKYKDGHEQIIDVKGMADTTALLKRKLMWYKYPELDYIQMTYNKKWANNESGWIDYDELQKIKRDTKKNK